MRSDSITAAVVAAQAAAAPDIEPPDHIVLRECDRPFWVGIMRARPRQNWTDPDLEHAAVLARCKADIERVQRELDAETDIIYNATGSPMVNPKHNLIEKLARRAMALSRLLQVHAEGTVGEARDQAKKAGKEREAREQLSRGETPAAKPGFDGLIARSPVQ